MWHLIPALCVAMVLPSCSESNDEPDDPDFNDPQVVEVLTPMQWTIRGTEDPLTDLAFNVGEYGNNYAIMCVNYGDFELVEVREDDDDAITLPEGTLAYSHDDWYEISIDGNVLSVLIKPTIDEPLRALVLVVRHGEVQSELAFYQDAIMEGLWPEQQWVTMDGQSLEERTFSVAQSGGTYSFTCTNYSGMWLGGVLEDGVYRELSLSNNYHEYSDDWCDFSMDDSLLTVRIFANETGRERVLDVCTEAGDSFNTFRFIQTGNE